MSVQVSFELKEGPKSVKNNRNLAYLRLWLQEKRQKAEKKGNGYHIIIKNGATFIKKVTVRHNPVYGFEKK